MKTIELYDSLGECVQVGFERDDVPLVHVMATYAPAETLQPQAVLPIHWPCAVCDAHGYSSELFTAQWPHALSRYLQSRRH